MNDFFKDLDGWKAHVKHLDATIDVERGVNEQLRKEIAELKRKLCEKEQEIQNLRTKYSKFEDGDFQKITDALNTIKDFCFRDVPKISQCRTENPCLCEEVDFSNDTFKGTCADKLQNGFLVGYGVSNVRYGDIISLGRSRILSFKGIGMKLIQAIEQLMQEKGLWWNTDVYVYIRKYPLEMISI